MGNSKSVAEEEEKIRQEALKAQKRPVRRRNSLNDMISMFLKYIDDDFEPLLDYYQHQQEEDGFTKNKNFSYAKGSRYANVSKYILHGNMKELKRQIISNFANINRKYREYDGCTLVHLCCQEGYPEMLQYILDWDEVDVKDLDVKIDMNPKNDKGRSPLHLCFTPPVMTYLGQLYGVNTHGKVRFQLPPGVNEKDARDFLKPGGPTARQDMVDIVVSNGGNVNEKDFLDFTALHFASMWGWIRSVTTLLDAKADFNAVTVAGKTPLMLAVEFGHLDVIDLLLAETGIQVNDADSNGRTAIFIAIEFTDDLELLNTKEDQNVQYEIVERLLVAGANLNIVVRFPPPPPLPPELDGTKEGENNNTTTTTTTNPTTTNPTTTSTATINSQNKKNGPKVSKKELREKMTKNSLKETPPPPPPITNANEKESSIAESEESLTTSAVPPSVGSIEENKNDENKGNLLAAILAEEDDDPNTYKTLLELVCEKQLSDILHLLLDWKIEHELVSLLAMMEGDWANSVRDRLLKEEGENRKALALSKQLAEIEKRRAARADDAGTWVEYRDKREKSDNKAFYYNTASRRTQKVIPNGFILDRSIPVKEVISGLHFYH